MLPLLRYLRKKSINFSIYDEIINKKDDVFELKKLIMEKYKLLIKTRRNSIDNIQEKILVESSFVNNKYFLPPLVENNKYSKKLENLENKEIYLLLFIVLLTPSLIADERINFGIGNISCEGDIKNKYTSMLENVVDSLILSEKQKNMIVKWKRLGNEIKMFPNNFTDYTSSNIIQGFIGDCSFIVVLSLLLEHEKKYKSNLLTDLISPIRLPIKNERNLEVNIKKSVINNNVLCLYSCKIIFNGIWRNIYVDNLIPIDSNNNCLLSHFDDNKYYGVTLIEKAYLKVMANRYDSVGSNPAIDLFYLTGWIPETITINSKSAKKKNYFLNVWNRIKNSFKNGSCLVALGTNDLNKSNSLLEEQKTVNNKIIREEICNKTGLVTKHAYQLLRMVEIYDYKKDCIIRILLVRNPWGKISWKGKYSAYDKINWNNELSELLGYNISQIKDNGIFWIEWSEITKWFSHIYLAWDPDKITKYTSKFHGKWNSSLHNTILKDDLHLLYFYPQYKISIDYKNFNKLFKNNTSDRLCVSQNGALKNKLSENSNYSLYFDSNSQTVNEATNYLKNGIFGLLKKRIESEYNDEFSNNNLGDIWIVLNRHIDSIEHNDKCEESNVPYMSISIYRGKERLVTQERLPIMQGIYSNGNVVTYKTNIISLLREYESYNFEENQEFILVITQYESKSSFNYTLNIYSNVEINVKPIDNEFVNTQMSDLNGILSSQINVKYYELSGKILFSNQNERYCIDLYSDQKIQITPILKNKFNFSNSNVLNNKINNQKYILLILLETKECSGEFKMKFIPELYQFRENISKLGSSNDNYFNSNCKYIKVVCTNGRYILYVDFKDKRNHIKKGMLFKVIIYLKKI